MKILKQFFMLICLFSIVIGIGIKSVYAEPPGTDKPIDILYIDENDNNLVDHNEVLLVMSAEDYKKVFKDKVPLERMLRGQIGKAEYIALNNHNIMQMDQNKDSTITISDGNQVYKIYYAKLSGTIRNSYIVTLAKKHNMGTFKVIVLHKHKKNGPHHTIHFQEGPTYKVRGAAGHPHVGL